MNKINKNILTMQKWYNHKNNLNTIKIKSNEITRTNKKIFKIQQYVKNIKNIMKNK